MKVKVLYQGTASAMPKGRNCPALAPATVTPAGTHSQDSEKTGAKALLPPLFAARLKPCPDTRLLVSDPILPNSLTINVLYQGTASAVPKGRNCPALAPATVTPAGTHSQDSENTGAKALFPPLFAARLKPCPDTSRIQTEYKASNFGVRLSSFERRTEQFGETE
jgi:hypothetical protein